MAGNIAALICLLSLIHVTLATIYQNEFTNDLDGMTTHRGLWQWSNRADVGWQLPSPMGEGFALYNITGEGDELYDVQIPIENGANYTITFFLASMFSQSGTIKLQRLEEDGTYINDIVDFTELSDPNNKEWFTRSGTVEPSAQKARFGIFCHVEESNPEEVTGYLWGCAVDSLYISTRPAPTTTPTPTTTTPTTTIPTTTTPTTTTPTTTTPTTTTPTTTTPTTTTPTTTTPTTTTPTTTTPTTTTPTTTTPTTTTPTTTTPTTTTPTTTTPTTTTPTTTTPTTTSAPDEIIDFNFNNDTDGWVLGHSNGASWNRVLSTSTAIAPPAGVDYVLMIYPEDIYSSNVLALSPRLLVGSSGTITTTIEFFMDGSLNHPCYLRARRATSYQEMDYAPFINLDAYGNQINQMWRNITNTHTGLQPGEEFNIILEGSLGVDNLQSQVAVSRFTVEGAELALNYESDFFDFTNGLTGWSIGSLDGGRWMVYDNSSVNPGWGVPQPSNGNVLMVDRFDIHAGAVSIESPPIRITPGTVKQLQMKFWMKGSEVYPVSLRLGLKTLDGVYNLDPSSMVDLTNRGDTVMQDWEELENWYTISSESETVDYFQLTVVADLGGDPENQVAIDHILLETKPTILEKIALA